jgi:pyruvate dehydrogenase (quinone)
MKRVADLLVDTVVAAGVERVYGLAGDSLNGITDSIRPRDNIKWVQCGMKKLPPSPRGRKRI